MAPDPVVSIVVLRAVCQDLGISYGLFSDSDAVRHQNYHETESICQEIVLMLPYELDNNIRSITNYLTSIFFSFLSRDVLHNIVASCCWNAVKQGCTVHHVHSIGQEATFK